MALSRPPSLDADQALLADQVQAWLAHDPDPDTRAELEALQAAHDWAQLAERFAGRLSFGTAGLRAELGAGPLRMNQLVVRQAAAGLVRYLADQGQSQPLVVIGFDARHKSECFALDSAAVVAAAGGRAVLFETFGPTPLLAFAVRRLGADAGVMVTASHNPPADNGYKVYLGDGAQIVAPIDAEIAARIAEVGLEVAVAVAAQGPVGGSISIMDPEVQDAYIETVQGQLAVPPSRPALAARATLRVAYTPLHGVGAALVQQVFAAAGFAPLHLVAEQADPDPDFPTLAFPNPEEPGTLDLGLALARQVQADVLLANDPDADRLGVAVPDPGDPAGRAAKPGGAWRTLRGDEIGVLLADHLLRHRPGGSERLVVTTVVSSRLLACMAAHHGVHYAETLTGFKWIVRPGMARPDWEFVFGYEEALGYSVGSAVRDKDGIAAAVVFAELVATLRAEGSSVPERLEALARQFGLHNTLSWSKRFEALPANPDRQDGAGAAAMASLRSWPARSVGGVVVGSIEDLAQRPGVQSSDTLIWHLADGARVVFRPSGTEPKLKIYLEVIEPLGPSRPYVDAATTAQKRLAALRSDLEQRLNTE